MKIYYLPTSSLELSLDEVIERMRRHHWHAYFMALRERDQTRANYHRRLAESLQRRKV